MHVLRVESSFSVLLCVVLGLFCWTKWWGPLHSTPEKMPSFSLSSHVHTSTPIASTATITSALSTTTSLTPLSNMASSSSYHYPSSTAGWNSNITTIEQMLSQNQGLFPILVYIRNFNEYRRHRPVIGSITCLLLSVFICYKLML